MNTNLHELIYADEVHAIVGCAFEVLNQLGHGLLEKPYELALCVEFKLRRIPYIQQPRFDVVYKGVNVGVFIPDLIVFDNIIVYTKTIEHITNHEVGQVMNYLRLSNKNLG
ncbi:MAG: GxxExxY protein [Oscillospiraceae bacterium]|jgi:GxxExxY protein|nr:GxxExxY protein [Oscillospiraceae bacterium]